MSGPKKADVLAAAERLGARLAHFYRSDLGRSVWGWLVEVEGPGPNPRDLTGTLLYQVGLTNRELIRLEKCLVHPGDTRACEPSDCGGTYEWPGR